MVKNGPFWPRPPPGSCPRRAAATLCPSPRRAGRTGRGMEPTLGFGFDDSLFAPSRDRGRGGPRGPGYTARRCEPRWFCEASDCKDDVEILTAKKFCGDLAYRQRAFQKALAEYSSCLLLLPPSNIAMRRDVQEGQARCLAHLGRHQEALDIAEKLRDWATNTDHLTTVLNLQFAIYCNLENTEEMITCLQQLISLHTFNPWYWKLLAEAYMSLLQTPLFISEMKLNQCKDFAANNHAVETSSGKEMSFQCPKLHSWEEDFQSRRATERKDGDFVSCSANQTGQGSLCTMEESKPQNKVKHATFMSCGQEALKDVGIKACASFVRTRLLLQLMQLQQSSFALENNLRVQQEIEVQVKSFGLKEKSLLLITEVMGGDLIPEKLKEDCQGEVKCIEASALSSLVTASAKEFESKWFKKLQDSLCHLDCPAISTPS